MGVPVVVWLQQPGASSSGYDQRDAQSSDSTTPQRLPAPAPSHYISTIAPELELGWAVHWDTQPIETIMDDRACWLPYARQPDNSFICARFEKTIWSWRRRTIASRLRTEAASPGGLALLLWVNYLYFTVNFCYIFTVFYGQPIESCHMHISHFNQGPCACLCISLKRWMPLI